MGGGRRFAWRDVKVRGDVNTTCCDGPDEEVTLTQESARTVLVTGGTGSVGEDLVVGFASAGYAVTFLYHRSDRQGAGVDSEVGSEGGAGGPDEVGRHC